VSFYECLQNIFFKGVENLLFGRPERSLQIFFLSEIIKKRKIQSKL